MRVLVVADAANLGVKIVHACRTFARREVVTALHGQAIHRTWRASKAHVMPLFDDGVPLPEAVKRVGEMALATGAVVVPADVRAGKLANAVRVAFPDVSAVATMEDGVVDRLDHKGRFAAMVRDAGCPEPDTDEAQAGDELVAICRERGFPVVVKPPSKAGGLGVVRLGSGDDLAAYIARAGSDFRPVVVQSYIDGRDLGVSLYAEHGSVIAMTTQVWVAPNTLHYEQHEQAEEMAVRLVERFELSGPINFDFREDQAGNVYFLECNPRFWATLNLASALGANFVELAVRRALGEPFTIPRPTSRQRMVTLLGAPSMLKPSGWGKASSEALGAILLDLSDFGALSARTIEHLRQRFRRSRGVKPGGTF